MTSETLTRAQLDELRRLRDRRIPESMLRKGWPGFPEHYVDLRSMFALQRRGLVECGVHQTLSPSSRDGTFRGVWWRITEAGRAALATAEGGQNG